MKFVRVAAVAALSLFLSTAADAKTIALTTSDSVTLSADHQGTGDHGVVFVHGNGEDRSGWADMAGVLASNGLQVVSLDLRGHGASKGTSEDPLKMTADVLAAAEFLRKKGAAKITLIGSKMGGNIAFAAAAQDPEIESVVMISPALNANGVKVSSSLAGFGERRLLMLAGDDDNLAKKAVNMIDREVANGTVRILETGGSGMTLVNRATDLETMLLGWANGKQDVADLAPDTKVDGATENLETTGTKLGEK